MTCRALAAVAFAAGILGCVPPGNSAGDEQASAVSGEDLCEWPVEGCACRVATTGFQFYPPSFDAAAEELELDENEDGSRRVQTRALFEQALAVDRRDPAAFARTTTDWWNTFLRDEGDLRVPIEPERDSRYFEREALCTAVITAFVPDAGYRDACDRFHQAASDAFAALRTRLETQFSLFDRNGVFSPNESALRCVPSAPTCFRTTAHVKNTSEN